MSRNIRLPWIAGLLLIVASLVGASHLLQNPRAVEAGPDDVVAKERNASGLGVVCIGRWDVESGLLHLSPQQPGAVTEVLCFEGQSVKKGDVLLKVQDEPFIRKIAEAQAAVSIAETQVLQARKGIDQHQELVAAQQGVIRAKKENLAKGEAEYEKLDRLTQLNIKQVGPEEVKAAKAGLQALRELIGIEEANLRALQKSRPDEKVNEALRNVDLRRAQVEQARETLERCTLKAPQDGTILQIQASVGTQFGPQSTQAAMTFAPNTARVMRAEVDQEFAGRIMLGATATIQDEANVGPIWQGKVLRIGDAFLPPRPAGNGPEIVSSGNTSRVLEVIIALEPSSAMPRIGQRMRASIGGTPR